MRHPRRLWPLLRPPTVVVSRLAAPRPAHAAGVRPLDPPGKPAALGEAIPDDTAVTSVGRRFQVLTIVTVASLFALVTLGGVVRLTDSGLGCPDWPLCHGKVIPPLDKHTLIEYSHRLMASVTGLMVLAAVIVVWRSYRGQPWLVVPASLGLVLLVVQVLVGGVTVLEELPASIVVAHLAIAQALMAAMVLVSLVALRGAPRIETGGGRGWLPVVALGAALGSYAVLLTGAHVAASGATVSCGQEWPLCSGSLLPEGYYATMHMLHRVMALVGGLLIVGVLVMAWRRRRGTDILGWVAAAVATVFLFQMIVGGVTILSGFPMTGRLLHLAVATLVWVGLVILALQTLSAPRLRPEGPGNA